MWAIAGLFHPDRRELYVGTFTTRMGMQAIHARELGKTWRECYRQGDRAVKVKMTYEVDDD